MITIRPEQAKILATQNFEDRTLLHLKETFPRHDAVLGEAVLREVIKLGMTNAKGYGLTTERNIRVYIDFICLLGSGFDKDPQVPWTRRILTDRATPEGTRIETLHGKVCAYSAKLTEDYRRLIPGTPNSKGIEELQRLKRESLNVPSPEGEAEFVSKVAGRLAGIFPVKCKEIGEAAVLRTIGQGMDEARRYGVYIERGIILYVAMMFIIGADFANDPQASWARAILDDSTRLDSAPKTERLYAEAVSFLNRWFG